MRVRLALLGVLLVAQAAAPALAHTPGSAPVPAEGTFLLEPAVPQARNFAHITLSSLGLPIAKGDRLEYAWSANNGTGPAIEFDIHSHPNQTTGYVVYVNATSAALNGTWVVPDTPDPMVSFVNPSPAWVNVSYRFVLYAPPPDVTPLLIVPLALGAALGWFLWLRAGKGQARETAESIVEGRPAGESEGAVDTGDEAEEPGAGAEGRG